MLQLITPSTYVAFSNALAEMHRLRYRVFKLRLDWDVKVANEMERDHFDYLHPIYLLQRTATVASAAVPAFCRRSAPPCSAMSFQRYFTVNRCGRARRSGKAAASRWMFPKMHPRPQAASPSVLTNFRGLGGIRPCRRFVRDRHCYRCSSRTHSPPCLMAVAPDRCAPPNRQRTCRHGTFGGLTNCIASLEGSWRPLRSGTVVARRAFLCRMRSCHAGLDQGRGLRLEGHILAPRLGLGIPAPQSRFPNLMAIRKVGMGHCRLSGANNGDRVLTANTCSRGIGLSLLQLARPRCAGSGGVLVT